MRTDVCVLILSLCVAALGAGSALAADAVYSEGGRVKVRPQPVGEAFRGKPWPKALEEAFWERANHAIDAYRGKGGGGLTGEHEKWTYPRSMFDFLAGNRESSLQVLRALDGEHPHTLGVDLYWCFTLKNQPRKFFFFGEHGGYLDPAYMDRMRRAAAVWTHDDPRPTMELVLALEGPDPMVREYALGLLKEMRGKDLEKVAELCTNEDARQAVLEFARTPLAREDFGDDVEKWRAWWKSFADRDWKVFEEYERVINPNPHPEYGVGTGPVGATWDPKTRGGWVDARNTDNLRSMRETAAYLFAEEAGNEKVRRLYKQKLQRFVVGLYHVGMGEWDSENYHAHTIAPWLGLYDYARDPEVKLLGKAAVDWLVMAGALKYYRGGFGGPTKRDYGGGNKVFGAGVSHMLYLYFGQAPMPDPDPHYDDVHAVLSAYRPPMALVELAAKDFRRPVEMWDTKPTYSHWLPGRSDSPEFWETLYFGDTYYLGTVASKGGAGDVGPFKMLAYNSKRGCDFVVAYSGSRFNTKRARDQMAQYRNVVVYLRPDAREYNVLIPKTATVESDGGAWFVRLEKTSVAIHPIRLGDYRVTKLGGKYGGQYPEEAVLNAKAEGGGYVGFAMEVGEGDLAAFERAVKARARLDLAKLADGTVRYQASGGHTLVMTYNRENDLPHVVRDGRTRQWDREVDLYRPVGADGPVSLGWKDGTLTVRTAGHAFTQTVTADGKVTFSEE